MDIKIPKVLERVDLGEYAGELEIVAIGPLTNIARAIEADSEFARNVKRIWMMGGDYSRDFAEHNMKCDVAAAKIVFGSGVAISVMPLDVTRQVAISISDSCSATGTRDAGGIDTGIRSSEMLHSPPSSSPYPMPSTSSSV